MRGWPTRRLRNSARGSQADGSAAAVGRHARAGGKSKESQEDDLLERAIEVVKLQRRASISLLQRKLQIGYTRAARLIDLMEQKAWSAGGRGRPVREVLAGSPTGMSSLNDDEFLTAANHAPQTTGFFTVAYPLPSERLS